MEMSWVSRQTEMEGWYKRFTKEHENPVESLNREYGPFIEILAKLQGTILDIGGGAGLAGAYMGPEVQYIVIDPSPIWLDESWSSIRKKLNPEGASPIFIKGIGENLPFPSSKFDSILAFWSLNHASSPKQCIVEMHRVLKPQGKVLLVLEDMEPSWNDVARLCYQELKSRLGRHVRDPMDWHQDTIPTIQSTIKGDIIRSKATIVYKLSGKAWPLQSDHLRISEDDLRNWLQDRFRTLERNWSGGFVSYELERLHARSRYAR
jgi:ubiquinone/menaquinone biosynthesis C-methylase UbiE